MKFSERIEIKKEYYPDGSISYETPYKNGLRDGIEKRYRKDGSVWCETPYKNGKIENR